MSGNSVPTLMTSHKTLNHVATLKANVHELCPYTDDVTQHSKSCRNTEGHLLERSAPRSVVLSLRSAP
jgi:hypothetical protein